MNVLKAIFDSDKYFNFRLSKEILEEFDDMINQFSLTNDAKILGKRLDAFKSTIERFRGRLNLHEATLIIHQDRISRMPEPIFQIPSSWGGSPREWVDSNDAYHRSIQPVYTMPLSNDSATRLFSETVSTGTIATNSLSNNANTLSSTYSAQEMNMRLKDDIFGDII